MVDKGKTKPKTMKLDIGLVGTSGVGKTSLIRRYARGVSSDGVTSIATIGLEKETMDMEINDEPLKIVLWDPAGQENFSTLTKNYVKNLAAVIVVFDMTREQSLIDAMRWLKNIKEIKDCPIICVGNKADKTA